MISRALPGGYRTIYRATARSPRTVSSRFNSARLQAWAREESRSVQSSRSCLFATCADDARSLRVNGDSTSADYNVTRGDIPSTKSYGIIVTNDAAATKPDDIITQIPPINLDVAKKYTAVILLTKAFAAWALDSHAFIKGAIDKLFTKIKTAHALDEIEINLIVAVVDRVPLPNRETSIRTDEPSYETGFDGLAFCVAAGDQMLPNIFDESSIVSKHHALDRQRQSVISFASTSDDLTYGITSDDFISSQQVIQLPLATTMFENGLYSTLLASRWSKEFGTDRFLRDSSKPMTHAVIRLPFFGELHSKNQTTLNDDPSEIITPLVPITELRVIKASMGNIIRQIDQPRKDSVGAPASQGLEHAVAAWFVNLGISPRAVFIWALVIPYDLEIRDPELFMQLSTSNRLQKAFEQFRMWGRSCHDPAIFRALKAGARLHRVLSGGGGWGKKAGLLALDPDSTYHRNPKFNENVLEEDLSESEYVPQPLREIASPGDYICFFINPQGHKKNTATERKKPDHWTLTETKTSTIEFGVIPSTVDNVPDHVSSNTSDATLRIEYFDRYFGALSEGGMAYEFTPKPQQRSKPETYKTKVDIAFSRFLYSR